MERNNGFCLSQHNNKMYINKTVDNAEEAINDRSMNNTRKPNNKVELWGAIEELGNNVYCYSDC